MYRATDRPVKMCCGSRARRQKQHMVTCLQARASFVKPPRQKELRYQGPGPASVKCVKSSAAAGAQGLCCQICVKRQRGAGPKPFAVK